MFKSPFRGIIWDRIRRENTLKGTGTPTPVIPCELSDSDSELLLDSDGEQLQDACGAFSLGFDGGFS